MTIGYFHQLDEHRIEAVMELTKKSNWRMFVLDQWQDDSLECVLVKAHTWSMGVVHFIVMNIAPAEAAAFYFIDCLRAQKIVSEVLMNQRRK